MKNLLQLLKEDIAIFKHQESVINSELIYLLKKRLLPIVIHRVSHWMYKRKLLFFSKLLTGLNLTFFGCDISYKAKIDGGLYLPHPNGIVIGEKVSIGKNCIIHQGVSLDNIHTSYTIEQPKVGNFVVIEAGAKVLGNINVNDYSLITANSMVISDVPKFAIVLGIPSRVISYREII